MYKTKTPLVTVVALAFAIACMQDAAASFVSGSDDSYADFGVSGSFRVSDVLGSGNDAASNTCEMMSASLAPEGYCFLDKEWELTETGYVSTRKDSIYGNCICVYITDAFTIPFELEFKGYGEPIN